MSCTANEITFAASLLVFVIAAGHAEWRMSSLIKILKIRHGATWDFMGRPHPCRTGESDKHSASLLTFIMSDKYSSFKDAELTREVKLLRLGFAVNLAAMLTISVVMFTSPSIRGLTTFVCWMK